MFQGDFLLAVSEVAVAFAGFASIVTAIGKQAHSEDPRVNAGRLEIMIAVSLAAVLFSFLPFLPAKFGLVDSKVWFICSLVMLFVAIAMTLYTKHIYKRFGLENVGARTPLPYYTMYTGIILLCLLNISGITPAASEGYYLSCLFLFLGIAGFAFSRLCRSLLKTLGQ